jgi:hypothetical protein
VGITSPAIVVEGSVARSENSRYTLRGIRGPPRRVTSSAGAIPTGESLLSTPLARRTGGEHERERGGGPSL